MVAENLVRPFLRAGDDAALLRAMRLTVLGLGIAITAMALRSSLSIYQLVNESGKVVLVAGFVPLAAGLFWPRATSAGALASTGAGLVTWIALEFVAPEATLPPVLGGLLGSIFGMFGRAQFATRPRVANPPRGAFHPPFSHFVAFRYWAGVARLNCLPCRPAKGSRTSRREQ
jgi:Na+/proline symporter